MTNQLPSARLEKDSNSQNPDVLTAIGESVLRAVVRRYSHLQMKLEAYDAGPLDFDIRVAEQAGLDFEVVLAHADDTLYLGAGEFWMEYFPIHQPECVQRYEAAVDGLLSGRYRVVEHYRRSEIVKAQLQRPDGENWKTIGFTWRSLPLPFVRYESRILQNGHRNADV